MFGGKMEVGALGFSSDCDIQTHVSEEEQAQIRVYPNPYYLSMDRQKSSRAGGWQSTYTAVGVGCEAV